VTWYIELIFNEYYSYYENLNGFHLISSGGDAVFKNGISISTDTILVITQDSLQTQLFFNRDSDFVQIADS